MPQDDDAQGAFVILCRYAMARQIWWLIKHHKRISGLSLFIDDDIAATVIEGQSALPYRIYLLVCGLLPLIVFNRWMTHVWASTEALGERLRTSDIVPPLPSKAQLQHYGKRVEHVPRLRLIYHATGAHDGEHRFLMPIVQQLMHLFSELHFEVIASRRAARAWEDTLHEVIDRVSNQPKTTWEAYLDATARAEGGIMLVPLLSGRVNSVRADTKRIDICRMGLAAVFSASPVYTRCREPDDILIENDPEIWIETVSQLLRDAALRDMSRKAVVSSTARMIRETGPWLPGLENFINAP
ncbi:hypothetical protein [Rhizobium sp. RU33A]|uniref:hypothetical protein n=1 Tax=Rhizobium sp. RU33A TaxID=1907413 RepID=UPI001115A896|nr:hypothetical protein [Rhizobium sp. RU33A]